MNNYMPHIITSPCSNRSCTCGCISLCQQWSTTICFPDEWPWYVNVYANIHVCINVRFMHGKRYIVRNLSHVDYKSVMTTDHFTDIDSFGFSVFYMQCHLILPARDICGQGVEEKWCTITRKKLHWDCNVSIREMCVALCGEALLTLYWTGKLSMQWSLYIAYKCNMILHKARECIRVTSPELHGVPVTGLFV